MEQQTIQPESVINDQNVIISPPVSPLISPPPQLPETKKSKGVLIIVLSAITLCILLLSVGYFLFQKQIKQIITKPTSPVVEQQTNNIIENENRPENEDISKIITQVETIFNNNANKYSETKVTRSYDGIVWWISDKDLSIRSKNSPAATLAAGCKTKSQIKEMTSGLAPQIKQLFLQSGFSLNERNTSASYTDDAFYDYIEAYETGDVKCTLISNPDCGSTNNNPLAETLSITCTDQYYASEYVQEPLLQSLNIDSDQTVDITKESGDFALINVYDRRTGYYIIAKKDGNTWKKVYEGQDLPDCSLVNEYKIPADITSTCYQNDVEINNPNN